MEDEKVREQVSKAKEMIRENRKKRHKSPILK